MSNEADISLREEEKRRKHNERNRRYTKRHPDRVLAKRKRQSEWNKQYQKEWYLKNRERLLKKKAEYSAKNKEAIKKYSYEYYHRDPETSKAKSRKYALDRKNDPAFKARRSKLCTAWIKRKRREDPVYRTVSNLRRRLRSYVSKKSDRMLVLIGCSINELRAYLESLFEPWMNWGNYGMGEGKWVVDHIIPCAKFNLSVPDQQRECFHFSNLRPLCWRKNMEKSDS